MGCLRFLQALCNFLYGGPGTRNRESVLNPRRKLRKPEQPSARRPFLNGFFLHAFLEIVVEAEAVEKAVAGVFLQHQRLYRNRTLIVARMEKTQRRFVTVWVELLGNLAFLQPFLHPAHHDQEKSEGTARIGVIGVERDRTTKFFLCSSPIQIGLPLD